MERKIPQSPNLLKLFFTVAVAGMTKPGRALR